MRVNKYLFYRNISNKIYIPENSVALYADSTEYGEINIYFLEDSFEPLIEREFVVLSLFEDHPKNLKFISIIKSSGSNRLFFLFEIKE